jgi:DNA replication initiation complex subunit (GINS family)
MITYNDIYEALRKEKYSEQLQVLPKVFIKEVADYLKDKEDIVKQNTDIFSEGLQKAKKQLENAVAIFKELMLRRKKKLLELAFVSAETGISKRDFDNMLAFEKEVFDKIMKALGDGDKEVEKLLQGKEEKDIIDRNKLVMFKKDVEEFLDLEGNKIGPFKEGDIVNIPYEIANILIVDEKAEAVDDD